MTTAKSQRLYRLTLASAIIAAAFTTLLILLGWAILSGIHLVSISAFLSIAAVVILISGIVYILFWMALMYRSITTYLHTTRKIQKRGALAASVTECAGAPQKEL
ncbi:hypothetical protein [Methanorbis furvi]|uniref:Uncharacterized protein n=1 Tax=Methanorbis furvi TaxID=3028299 RepID=A0AAE4S8V7_9EURY|nr:hypothetical protein [Methanocorpusculaceae archaeon Ag1]